MSMERVTVRSDKNRDEVLREMRRRGYRITEQRKILVDVILKDQCRCCKEIYYEAAKKDPSMGIATVYRTVGALQDMGILRRDYSRPVLSGAWECEKKCKVCLSGEKQTRAEDEEELYETVRGFLQRKGYLTGEDFKVTVVVD